MLECKHLFWGNVKNMRTSDLARKLAMAPAGVSYAVRRGGAIVPENNFQLLK